jgi:hypothetical protein
VTEDSFVKKNKAKKAKHLESGFLVLEKIVSYAKKTDITIAYNNDMGVKFFWA